MEDILKQIRGILRYESCDSLHKICRNAGVEIAALRQESARLRYERDAARSEVAALRAELCPPAHPESPLQRAFEMCQCRLEHVSVPHDCVHWRRRAFESMPPVRSVR